MICLVPTIVKIHLGILILCQNQRTKTRTTLSACPSKEVAIMYSVKLAYDDADLRTRPRIPLISAQLLSRLYRHPQLSRIFLYPRLIRLHPGEFDISLLRASANMEAVEPCEMCHRTTHSRHGVVKHRVSFKVMRQSKP